MADPRSGTALVLLTREGCELCEEFFDELLLLREHLELPEVTRVDVDGDPQLRQRYGLKIPVLLWDGTPIGATRVDAAELARLFRSRR